MTPKIALVGPNFFSYIQAIRQGFSSKGIQAEFFDERHSNSILVKILYRVGFYEVFVSTRRKHLESIAEAIIAGGFSDVLLIATEVCDELFVATLKAAGLSVHLYMWDSAKNKPRFLKFLSSLNGKSSFDPQDCAKYGMEYIPLFSEESYSTAKDDFAARDVDISFCGTLHSNRAVWLHRLSLFGKKKSLKLKFLIFSHSKIILLLTSIRCSDNLRFIRSVSSTGFSKQEIARLFACSKYVFDIPHPGQIGLTARTFEALRSGARLITLNRFSSSLPAGLQSRIVLLEKLEDMENIDFSTSLKLPPLSEDENYFLSIRRFADQLLVVMQLSDHAD